MNTKFFIGCSPSQATTIINPEYPAFGVMVTVNRLRKRKSNFEVKKWILDSGAFTEISRHGKYRFEVDEYCEHINRWSICGNLLIAVAQDFMCEDFVLKKTGLSVARHQELTIQRYDRLLSLNPKVPIMPVLQGYRSSDYLKHLQDYGDRLTLNQWVGVGSVCKRNNKPAEIANLLKTIKLVRSDLKIHGFGLKQIALENREIRSLLYSCDSMAWSYPRKYGKFPAERDNGQNSEIALARDYQKKIHQTINDAYSHNRSANSKSGAGNGQGRKPKWKSGKTQVIRVPEVFVSRLIKLAKQWDAHQATDDDLKPKIQELIYSLNSLDMFEKLAIVESIYEAIDTDRPVGDIAAELDTKLQITRPKKKRRRSSQ